MAGALSLVADPSRLAALRRAPQDDANPLRSLLKKFFRIPYPRPQNLAYPDRVLSNEGPLSRSDPSGTERKLAGPGRPGTVDGLVAGGALGGAAPSLGRARCLAARGGSVNPASKGASQALWRLPPLHPLARFARDWQTSDALRRENGEVWLFETVDRNLVRSPDGAKRNPESVLQHLQFPAFPALHPGYEDSLVSRARCSVFHAASQNRDPGYS
jgi:hypothetical protein